MKTIAIIPARMGSSRFPGKPLAPIAGKPMVQWVYEGARLAPGVSGAYVATCDDEIRTAAEAFGAPVIMTAATHERASDRVAEAARGLDADVIVMVQGDEPMTTPEMLAEAVEPFTDPDVLCTNLAAPIESEAEHADPNTIKVVFDLQWNALYFSRSPIPWMPAGGFVPGTAWKQVCVIGFRSDFLDRYTRLAPTEAERRESIDMLRILEHGMPVRMVRTAARSQAVDTPADLARVEQILTGKAT